MVFSFLINYLWISKIAASDNNHSMLLANYYIQFHLGIMMVYYGLISSESEYALPNSHPSSFPRNLPEAVSDVAAASALMCLWGCKDNIMRNKSYEENRKLPALPNPKLPQAFAAAACPGLTALA